MPGWEVFDLDRIVTLVEPFHERHDLLRDYYTARSRSRRLLR